MTNHDLFSFIKIAVRVSGTIFLGAVLVITLPQHVVGIVFSVAVMCVAEVFGVLEEIM